MATNLEIGSVNSKIIEFLKPLGIVFDFVYFCPHLPDDGCNCRKPELVLGLRAIAQHDLDPSVSFMVGDQESDMIFGRNLGCRTIQLRAVPTKAHSQTTIQTHLKVQPDGLWLKKTVRVLEWES